ncbi:hypothetical protein JI58_02780 [Marinosulfonomonas sp. PRT-SC04]|nr:hypothetical protein JI58_02780 [Marinosulfonomonas sp. PRT-SC04]
MTTSRAPIPIPILIMAVLSGLVALGTYRFLLLGLPMSFQEMIGHIDQRRVASLLHISVAPVALVLGSLQLFPRLRARKPALHRWVGRVYGGSILIAGGAGLVVAPGAAGGIVVSLGFGLLAVLWLGITANAVRLAVIGRIAQHRRWMYRSFALTFSAVTLRLYLLGFMAAGFSYTEASIYLAWICWVPNLLFAEWFVRRFPRVAS